MEKGIVEYEYTIKVKVDKKNISKKYPNYKFNYESPKELADALVLGSELVNGCDFVKFGYRVSAGAKDKDVEILTNSVTGNKKEVKIVKGYNDIEINIDGCSPILIDYFGDEDEVNIYKFENGFDEDFTQKISLSKRIEDDTQEKSDERIEQ
jgi:hypothetical protein